MFGRGEMNSNMTFLGHLITVAASFSLVLGGCSAIEVGSNLPGDRRFEPELTTKVAVVKVSERASSPAQPASADPQAILAPTANWVSSRQLPEISPSDPSDPVMILPLPSGSQTVAAAGDELQVAIQSSPHSGSSDNTMLKPGSRPAVRRDPDRNEPQAGERYERGPASDSDHHTSVSGDAYSADFLRRMKASARALRSVHDTRQAKTPGPSGSAGREADETLQLAASRKDPESSTVQIAPDPELLTEFEAVEPDAAEILLSTTVAPAVRNAGPIRPAQAKLAAQIGFSGDKRELSPADREQLEALSNRLRTGGRRVHIRALTDTSIREPSQARRLALRRLFAVRDYLVDRGLPRASVTLDAIAAGNLTVGDERVEIAAGPAENRAPRAAGAPLNSPPGSRSGTQFAAAIGPATPVDVDTHSRPGAKTATSRPATSSPAPPIAVNPADRAETHPPPRSIKTRPADQAARHGTAALYVQVGSHQRKQDALNQADRLGRAFASLLGPREFQVTAVDLEGRGRFHRVRTGPFLTRSGASALCRELRQEGQDCLVMRGKSSPAGS